jgi:DNA-binding MarR family transcriptional regulator
MPRYDQVMSKNRSAQAAERAAERAIGQTAIAGTDGGAVLDLERYVPALITFIANKLSRSASALYRKRFHVNITEWRILALLAIQPGIPAAHICHIIGFDKGPVSRTLSLMRGRGLVAIKSDPNDGRTRAISLTPKGRATHDEIIGIALERERRLLACLQHDEREQLIQLLVRVHSNLAAVTDRGID